MIKEIEINGCVTVPNDLTHDEFLDKFINFIVAKAETDMFFLLPRFKIEKTK